MTDFSESPVQASIRLALGQDADVKLFRNNVGSIKIGDRFVRFGLIKGSADMIGWRSLIITPEMVGRRFARFVSIEAKRTSGGKRADDQINWERVVREAGGIAGFANSPEKARLIIMGEK